MKISHAVCQGANTGRKTFLGKSACPNNEAFVPKSFLRAELWNVEFVIMVS
jgi:hypothetical protein